MILEIRNTMERLDNREKNIEGGLAVSQTAGEWTMVEDHAAEREIAMKGSWRFQSPWERMRWVGFSLLRGISR